MKHEIEQLTENRNNDEKKLLVSSAAFLLACTLISVLLNTSNNDAQPSIEERIAGQIESGVIFPHSKQCRRVYQPAANRHELFCLERNEIEIYAMTTLQNGK